MAHAPQMPELPGLHSEKKRPWYAVALMGGFGAVLGVALVFGLIGPAAHGQEPNVAMAGVTVQVDQAWRSRMEQKIDQTLREVAETRERLARMEGRLDGRK